MPVVCREKVRQRSPPNTLDEDSLHSAIVTALNEYGAIRAEVKANVPELAEEKQSILDQIAAHQQDEEQRIIQKFRRREQAEWLDQQPLCFTQYDDSLIRRLMERITVVDTETVQAKIRDTDVVGDGKLC